MGIRAATIAFPGWADAPALCAHGQLEGGVPIASRFGALFPCARDGF